MNTWYSMEQKQSIKSIYCRKCGRGFSDQIPRLGNATRAESNRYNNCPKDMENYYTACYYQYF